MKVMTFSPNSAQFKEQLLFPCYQLLSENKGNKLTSLSSMGPWVRHYPADFLLACCCSLTQIPLLWYLVLVHLHKVMHFL